MKKIFSIFLLSVSFFAFALEPIKSGDALKDSADLANRRTALRCLSNATNYAAEKNFGAAMSQAQLGIAYDDSISDLWYVVAACSSALGNTRAEILPVLERSLEINNWVNYNRDNARLMAADILSETNRLHKALELLDSKPMLYSSDAEFVRVKIYYRLGGSDSVSKARNKIDGARRIYPTDTRFPLVFFKFENPDDLDANAKRLSEYFIAQIAQYQEASPDKDAELEIYAASFAQGEVKKRLLKSFSARGLKHPLYAKEALKAGLIDQQHAFEYVCMFAENEIDYDMFKGLILNIDDDKVIEYISEYMESFEGSVVQDTDGDGNSNILVKYVRGRPQEIFYDRNQDGKLEWTVECDFGVPVSGNFEERKMSFEWSQFPYLSSLSFNSKDKDTLAGEKFTFAGESIMWTPVLIENDEDISTKTGKNFFYPVLNPKVPEISNSQLLDAASAFEIDSLMKNGEKISFVLLNGNVTQAMYYKDNVLYAQAQFEGNIPVLRVVDFDNDGVFETTEFYDLDEKGDMEVHSLTDERTIMQNLYGVPSNGAEFYLRMVQIDTDRDTVPDFTEEYLPHGGKITSWDTDSNGKWNVRHVVYADEGKGKKEDSMFYVSPKNLLVKVAFIDGMPKEVSYGVDDLQVTPGNSGKLYWLSKNVKNLESKKYTVLESKVLDVLDGKHEQGISSIVEESDVRAICIRIAENNFALIIEESDWNENEKE
ncbi:tetratricopeptide repeat protein [Treponema sp.]|uniref:tetratricopeptide repeat protein n=1 Tax=Treponema sp. TaxID=166 RepID=UPI00388DF19F